MVRENVDVIVCVEATAVGGYNIKNIKTEYLIPALEYYSGTQEYMNLFSHNSFFSGCKYTNWF